MNIFSLKRLFRHVSSTRRLQFSFLLVLTVASSCSEVISLGAVVPFIAIITQPEKIFSYPLIPHLASSLGINEPNELVGPIAMLFVVAAVLAGALRIAMLWTSIRLGNATGADLSVEMYRRTLYQPFSVHVTRSSSEIISGITQKVATATSVLTSVVTVITSAILFFTILVTLFVIDPIVAGFALVTFGGVYALIAVITKQRLRNNGSVIASQQTNVVKSLQEGLGAIRDVLLDGTQDLYVSIYRERIQQLQRATGENQYITLAPRYVMEALGMALFGLFAYFSSNEPGAISAAMPTLAALALGAQRLLPLLQQLYGNFTFVMGSQSSLEDVVALLDQPMPKAASHPPPAPIEFEKHIQFEDIGFRYSLKGPWVLDNLNLIIKKGTRVGLVGSTGSGKSTALNLLMCLLTPSRGRILVDDQPIDSASTGAWQRTIAHVPQSIYLADASIAQNIAFGIPFEEVDFERVREAAAKAQLTDFIEHLPEGYETVVGERGARLSGGQRQRIGIARALYKKASVLIFDEATSALDTDTERSVMEAIEGLGAGLTIILIAHRISTLKTCDEIVELSRGGLAQRYDYQQLIQRNQLAIEGSR